MYTVETGRVIRTLKRALKDKQLTYADVADGLDMSESNVKRMFAVERMTLGRIEAICTLMGIELSDLFQLYEESRQRISQLTEDQEKELVADARLLLVAISVRNNLGFDEILKYYNIGESELVQCLARLDRLQIIDLLPGNQFRLRIAPNFRWIPRGPIDRYYEKAVQTEFLEAGFDDELNPRIFLGLLLSDASQAVIARRFKALSNEIAELHRQDSELQFDKRNSVGVLLAMRGWRFRAFKEFIN